MKFRICLLAAGFTLMGWNPAEAQVPSQYQDLYDSLNANINAFGATLGTPPAYPTLYTSSLLRANANVGPGLLNPGAFFGLQLQLDELQALGVQGVVVEVGFPMLYAPFFSSVTDYQNYVTFYSQVAYAVRQAGMKLIVENDILLNPSTAGSAWNTSAFYATLTWDQYVQARAQTAAVLAQTMQPDYLVLAEEQATEANTTGQTNVNTAAGITAMVGQMITSVQQSGVTGVQLGAGVATWQPDFQTITQSLVTLPLNFIDFHIYETNFNFPSNALTIASIAQSAGMAVTMSECWLHKVRDAEWGVLTEDQIMARNPFDFWIPLDTLFLQTMQNLANYTQMTFLNAFPAEYFFTYLPYNSNTSILTPDQITNSEQQAAGQANQQATFSATGSSYHNAIVTPPDSVAPTVPTALTAHNKATSISWTASTDNVGVAGYYVYRNGAQVASTSLVSYQDSGLNPGTTYSYTVAAFDEAGNASAQSLAVNMTPPATTPSAPGNVAAVALSSEKVKLTWSASTGPSVANYLVFWGTSPDPASLTQVATPTTTSYTDFPLSPLSTYYYGVQAVATTTGNVSPMSAIVAVNTPDLPAIPGSVTANPASSTQITVSWTAATGAFPISKYYIFRGAATTGMTQVASVTSSFSSYTDNSLTPGGTYYYAVQAIDNVGDLSQLSDPVAAATYPLPGPPGSLTATANSTNQIVVTWAAPTSGLPIAKYYVFQGTSPTAMSQVASRVGTTYTDNSVSPATAYYYAVEAVDTANDVSPMSSPATATTYAVPSTPTGETATTATDAKISFMWAAATVPPSGLPVASYNIYQGTSATGMNKVATRTGTLYTDTTVTPGNTYYYGVATVDTAGDTSPVSAAVSAVTYVQPTAPVVSASALVTRIDLSWTASTASVPISGYAVFRGSSPSSLTQIAAPAGTTYSDTSLTAATTYYYSVQATDTADDLSPMSAVIAATTQPLPGSNAVTATTLSDAKIALSWAAPSGVTVAHYNLFRGPDPSSLVQIATVTIKSYKDTGLPAATTYYYAEQAVDNLGNVLPLSPTVSATTYQVPTTPTLSASVASFAEIDLSWTASTASVPIDHYNIFRGPSTTTLVLLTSSATTTYADTTLAPSTTYYYAVQAVDSAGDVSTRSNKISLKTQPPPPPINLTGAPDSSTRISLAWAPPATGPAVASYNVFRGTSPTGLAQLANTAALAYTDNGLTPAATYYYAVQAVDTSGQASVLSASVSVATYALPSAPTNLQATATISSIALTWSASTGPLAIASYNILRGASANSLSLVATSLTNSYTDSSLNSGTTYYYAIQAVDTAGDLSQNSAVLSTATHATVSAPTFVAASATSNHSVLVSWQPSQSALPIAHYYIYRGSNASNLSKIATIGTQLSYTDSSASPNSTYYYAVQGGDSAGNLSALSSTATATTPQSNGHGNGGGHGH